MKAAFDARAEVRHYPCDHFDVLPGGEWFDAVVEHQLLFLRNHGIVDRERADLESDDQRVIQLND
ncbi:hypothetical protein [Gordonia neofelifaecis]|uniref:hypothetical protein n=1 Tax=Gordonia neofelifaecis TaxID=945692 RepID=UPI0002D42F63